MQPSRKATGLASGLSTPNGSRSQSVARAGVPAAPYSRPMRKAGSAHRLANAAAAFTSNARNPNLRRAQLSFLGAWTAEWAFTVGLGIVAYRDGGATAVGLVGLLRMVPSAILRPAAVAAGRQGPPGARTDPGLRAAWCRHGAAAAVVAAWAVRRQSSTRWRCCRRSLPRSTDRRTPRCFPSLCHTGYELASANVVRGLLDSAATLVGPLLAAVLLQVAGVTVVFAVAAGASLWAAALLLRLQYDAPPRPSAPERAQPGAGRPSKASAVVSGTATWPSSWALRRRSHSPAGR